MSQRHTPALRDADNRSSARRRKLASAGQWQPFVDAEPVREHLRKINAAGMPYMAISKRLGLPQETSLQYLMWGRGKYGPGKQVRTETAELVLAFWPSLEDFPDGARIDATGTRRRVEALAVRGWARHLVAKRVGMCQDGFFRACGKDRVPARVARAVAAVYDAWWDQDPLEHGVSRRSVLRVRADAKRSGFHSALAWDDDTIDDPAAVPLTDADRPVPTAGDDVLARFLMGESVILNAEGRRGAIRHFMEWTNLTSEEIGDRLEMEPTTVSRAWERMKRKALDEGGRVPWRRVYVPRTKQTINQYELESAA